MYHCSQTLTVVCCIFGQYSSKNIVITSSYYLISIASGGITFIRVAAFMIVIIRSIALSVI